MSRKIARESVYKLVFEYIFTGKVNEYTYEIMMCDGEFDEDDKEYISSVYRGVVAHYDELKEYIAAFAIGYSPERIVKADKAALLVAVYEMKFMEIPMSVSINEAVDIVKKYSTEKSSAFVNGILASIYKDLTGENNG